MIADGLPGSRLSRPSAEWATGGASGAWDWDIEQQRLYVDAAFAELYGLDPDAANTALPPSVFYLAIHPEDRPRMRIAVAGMLGGAELFSKEFRIIDPDGGVLWMHGRGHTLLDDDDRPVRFTGLLVDVTERKRTEERLRIAQAAGGIGTFEYTDGFATVAVSNEFCSLLGLHPAPALPVRTINAVVVSGDRQLIPQPGGNRAPETLDGDFAIVRGDDGKNRWIACRGEIVREGSGYRLIGVIYDITASRKQEEQLRELNDTLEMRVEQEVAERQLVEDALRQAQKMEAIGQLTGGIAHDFNNLLMAILSGLELMRKRVSEPELVRLLDNSVEAAERGAVLTQRMLAFARRQELTTERVAIPRLVAGMMDLLRRSLGPAFTIQTDFPADISPIAADANQLEMALLNLAVNARDAMPDGGMITIAAAGGNVFAGNLQQLDPGRYVRLSVSDRGSGMDAATLAKAIDPFFTTKDVGKGTGLGLSMIHGFAHQIGGAFQLESVPGRGTTAHIWLPAISPNASDGGVVDADQEQEGPSGMDERSLTILVVDDDAIILMNTAALLEDLGHRVYEACSGTEALALFRTRPDIDLLITDQAMPAMTGSELIAAVRAERPDLPIILATGYGEAPTDAKLAIHRLGKPFGQTELQRTITAATV
jgi:PAS domain S-box-containing protein